MPLYSYRCRQCGEFDALMPVAACELPVDCPECGGSSARVLTAPRLALMSASSRHAHETNERSSHEPRLSRKTDCCSGGGCAHHGRPSSGERAPLRRGGADTRPWMLGH